MIHWGATVLSAILASIWLGSCLVVAVTLLLQAMPGLKPRWRYRVWLLVLVATFAGLLAARPTGNRGPANVSAVLPAHSEEAEAPASGAGNPFTPPVTSPAKATPAAQSGAPTHRVATPAATVHRASLQFDLPTRIASVVVALLLFGAAVGLLRIAWQLLALARLKRRASVPSVELLNLWQETLRCLPTGRTPRVLVSGEVLLPVACGYLRPAVLVPRGLIGSLSAEETRHVLLHELAHLVRRDDWGLLFERFLGALCWWHPVVWWVARRLEQAREEACDSLVAAGSDRRGYARTLVHLAELSLLRSKGLAPGALRGELTRRIEALLAAPSPAVGYRLTRRAPAALLAGIIVVGGFRIGPPRVSSSPAAVPSPTAPLARLTSATGFAAGPEGLRLDSLFRAYADSGFSGTILLARSGEILLDKGYGLADRERGIPATAGTRYSTAGMTKLFTATALLSLAAEGRLQLTDSVNRWVEALTGPKGEVTLDELLTYRDGLTRLNAPVQRDNPGDFVQALALSPASFTPGTSYRYSDHGHSLLGLVIERATGERYESYVRRRFLQPAGLTATGFENEGGPVAVEYSGPATALQPVAPRAYRWGRRASLGLVSTADDLYRWFQELSDSSVVSPAVRSALFRVRTRTDYGSDQAYGLELVNRGVGHRLWRRVAGTPGFEGELLHDPDSGWTAVILVNTRQGWRFRVWRDIERAMWSQ